MADVALSLAQLQPAVMIIPNLPPPDASLFPRAGDLCTFVRDWGPVCSESKIEDNSHGNRPGGSEIAGKSGHEAFGVSLGGLMVLVLAAGLAAGVVRSFERSLGRGLGGVPAPTSGAGSPVWAGGEVPVERTAGVVLEVAGVFLVVVLCAR